MTELLLFALAGFAASLVDGALGMGFGPTSSSILLSVGLAPASVSASVNLVKVATGVAAGLSHWRFRNVDRELVIKLAVPGCVGALLGTLVLSRVSGAAIRPYLAMLLTVIGLRILVRFARPLPVAMKDRPAVEGSAKRELQYDRRGVKTAGFLGGVTNGLIGAWGPVVTPFLLHRGVRPRFAIGSVNTAEVAVASTAAFSLIASLGSGGFQVRVLVPMLVGGVVAAPVAAWMIRHVPARAMGVSVAALLLLTNARDIAGWAGVTTARSLWLLYGSILALVLITVVVARRWTPDAVVPQAEAPEPASTADEGRRG